MRLRTYECICVDMFGLESTERRTKHFWLILRCQKIPKTWKPALVRTINKFQLQCLSQLIVATGLQVIHLPVCTEMYHLQASCKSSTAKNLQSQIILYLTGVHVQIPKKEGPVYHWRVYMCLHVHICDTCVYKHIWNSSMMDWSLLFH